MNLNMRPMKLHPGHWIMTGSAFASVGTGSLCNNAGQQGSTRWQDIFSSAARQSIWLFTLSENFHTRDFQKAFQFHPSGSFSTELHPLSLLVITLCFLVVRCAQTMARPCRWLNMIEEYWGIFHVSNSCAVTVATLASSQETLCNQAWVKITIDRTHCGEILLFLPGRITSLDMIGFD